MNDLLFYTLIIALLYYFFLYLPQQKSISSNLPPQPFTHNQETQTANQTQEYEPGSVNCPSAQFIPIENKELETTLDILIKNIQTLNKELDNPSLTELQSALTIASQKLAGKLP